MSGRCPSEGTSRECVGASCVVDAWLSTPARAGNGLVERDREGTSEDEIKPIDWLVPVG